MAAKRKKREQRPLWRDRSWSRFLRQREGSAAIEFGLVALPFFFMLIGTIETTTIYFASATLENGLQQVARRIRTGQVQAANLSEQELINQLCSEVDAMLECSERLRLDVRTFDQFNNVEFTPPLDEDGNVKMSFQFEPGAAGDVVLVRAFYVWNISTPLLGDLMSNMSGNHHLIAASVAFRNEPFGNNSQTN